MNATYGPTANAADAWRTSAAVNLRNMGGASILLKLSGSSLARRQDLEARRPPAGLDRLDEFIRKLLFTHLPRQSVVVVIDWYEFDVDPRAGDRQHRVPDVRLPVICRPADDANVHDVPAARQALVPMQSAVRADDDVGLVVITHFSEECIGRGRPPQELVDLSRRTVREKNSRVSDCESHRPRECSHPVFVRVRGVLRRVVVGNLRVKVVTRIGVAAVTVGRTGRE